MILKINGKRVVLKRGSSFEYVSENRFFTDADAYTLAIELPLKDCPQNLEIFGHINRKDVSKNTNLMLAELRSGTFLKRGSIAITEISEVSVKVQFLEGRSEQNCAEDFDTIYINELSLGYNTRLDYEGEVEVIPISSWPVSKLNSTIDSGQEWQALPWVNNYTGNIQNNLTLASGGASYASGQSYGLSYQIYLYALTERIFKAVGYKSDLTAWRDTPYYHLLCCNTLPAAWGILNYAMALPHWSLTEYIEQLEMLMYCEFDINHTDRTIKMKFTSGAMEEAGTYHIERVVDAFKVSQEDESACKYKDMTNIKYADCDHELWKYYSCPWIINHATSVLDRESWLSIKEYSTLNNMLSDIPTITYHTGYDIETVTTIYEQRIYHVQSLDRYYVVRRIAIEKTADGQPSTATSPAIPATFKFSYAIQPINRFCPAIADENADTSELKIVPAWLDDLGDSTKGYLYFLDCGELDNERINKVSELLAKGESEQQQVFDKLYVGFWVGDKVTSKYPHPFLDDWEIDTDKQLKQRPGYTLALRTSNTYAYKKAPQINRAYKYSFSFLSDEVPDVRAVFIILGRKYVCEKITATFTEDGMSQLLKGDFYEVV